jgi:hypothetical protein
LNYVKIARFLEIFWFLFVYCVTKFIRWYLEILFKTSFIYRSIHNRIDFFNHDIFKMTFILIMWIDIKFCLIFEIFSSFSFELNFKKCDLNIFKNVSFIVYKFIDEISFAFKHHSYTKRWSIKFWLKSLSINANIRMLFVEITKIINAHKWKFFFTHFRIINMWIMSIDFCFFSTICRCRHCDIEIYNVLLCHKYNKLYATNSSLNELFFVQSQQW